MSDYIQNFPISLQLVARHLETSESVSFYFQPAAPITFKPGQFLIVRVNIEQTDYYRAYSISSLASHPQVRLTIKRVDKGRVSNWLIDHLKLGDMIEGCEVAGDFNIVDRQHTDRLLFISAGCGITPVYAMVQMLLTQRNTVNEIQFLHCAKDEDHVIYADEIAQLTKQYRHFHLTLSLKNRPLVRADLTDYLARVTETTLKQHYPDLHHYTIFLCGPNQFMTEIKQILSAIHFDLAHFYYESFDPLTPIAEKTTPAEKTSTIHISVPDFNFTQTANIDDNLLTILESGQLPIIGACRTGVCGACKCKIEHGDVESHSMQTLTAEEIAQGYRLACSSTVKSDVQIALC